MFVSFALRTLSSFCAGLCVSLAGFCVSFCVSFPVSMLVFPVSVLDWLGVWLVLIGVWLVYYDWGHERGHWGLMQVTGKLNYAPVYGLLRLSKPAQASL